jgi:hypothetical protein
VGRAGLLVFWALTPHVFSGKDYCFPSRKTLSKEMRLSNRTITRAIKELRDSHYLIVESKAGEVNRYKLRNNDDDEARDIQYSPGRKGLSAIASSGTVEAPAKGPVIGLYSFNLHPLHSPAPQSVSSCPSREIRY